MTRGGWLALAALVAGSTGFAYLNRGERAAVHLGVATFYQTPVAGLVLASFVAGMLTMFLLGLRTDIAVQRALRERGVVRGPSRDDTELYPPSYTSSDS